jgi:hypothetical protein
MEEYFRGTALLPRSVLVHVLVLASCTQEKQLQLESDLTSELQSNLTGSNQT